MRHVILTPGRARRHAPADDGYSQWVKEGVQPSCDTSFLRQVALLALVAVCALSLATPPRGADGAGGAAAARADGGDAAPDAEDAEEHPQEEHGRIVFAEASTWVAFLLFCSCVASRAPRGRRAAAALAKESHRPSGAIAAAAREPAAEGGLRFQDALQGAAEAAEAHAGIPVAPPPAEPGAGSGPQQV